MDSSILPDLCPNYTNKLNLYYSKIISHAITADGKYLLALIKSGSLALFPLKNYLKDVIARRSDDISQVGDYSLNINRLKPISLIPVSNLLSLCMENSHCSDYKFLIGGKGSIKGHHLLNNEECIEDWTIKLSSDSTLSNTLLLSNDKIFTGCSDNNIYVYDKESHTELHKLTGHQDYIHCLKLSNSQSSLIYSGSEDGSVRIWDIRSSNESISVILPFKKPTIERSQFGKWIGSLDVSPNGEWLVCGGGPSLSMWHLRSNKFVHVIDTPGVSYVTQFLRHDPSNVIVAGSGNLVNLWQLSEDKFTNQINTFIDNIYSICNHNYEDLDYNLYSFAGDSFKIELCKNAKFVDCALYVS